MDWAQSKAFADNKLNVAKVIFHVYNRIQNTVVKGENADNRIISYSHNVFKRPLLWGGGVCVIKTCDIVVKG